jgi:hypothetical protein
VPVAVILRDQAEHERGDYEHAYSSLCGSEAESLPQFFEFETPVLFNQVATPSKWLQSEPLTNYKDLLLTDYLSKSASFVAQRFDRVEVGCSIGGVKAEADADRGTNKKSGNRPAKREDDVHF